MTSLQDHAGPATAVMVPASIERSRRVDRWFYIGVAMFMINTPLAHVIGHWALQEWAIPIVLSVVVLSLSSRAIHDRVAHGRIHPVSVWGAVLAFACQTLFFSVIQPSSAWRDFAAWLIQ